MNDRELDRLIARANPYGDQTVANLPTGGAEADLLEEIMTTATPTITPVDPGGPVRRTRRRLVLIAVAAVTALIALGGVFLPNGGGGPVAPPRAFAAELVKVAEANPRLLIDEPGWKITYVEEFSAPIGMMRFSKGSRHVDLSWMRAGDYRSYLQDRGRESAPTPIEVLGRRASMFHYTGSDYTTILPPQGTVFVQIRADLGSEQEYRRVVGLLRPVDVTTWLSALPASAVRPEQKADVISEMLVGVPLPKGFDRRKLNTGTTTDRYHVGASVGGAVACAWIDRWVDAKKKGDDARLREAAAALKSARSWKFLRQMRATGAYPNVLWEIADRVAAGQLVIGKPTGPKQFTLESTRMGLGCR